MLIVIDREFWHSGARRLPPNHRLQPTWLIGALLSFFTRISVHFVATVLTPHPPSGSTWPLGALV